MEQGVCTKSNTHALKYRGGLNENCLASSRDTGEERYREGYTKGNTHALKYRGGYNENYLSSAHLRRVDEDIVAKIVFQRLIVCVHVINFKRAVSSEEICFELSKVFDKFLAPSSASAEIFFALFLRKIYSSS